MKEFSYSMPKERIEKCILRINPGRFNYDWI